MSSLVPEEISAAVPVSDKRLAIEQFIDCDEVDTTYFDKPYFVTPADEGAAEAFALIREGMRANKVAALARAVLFRRVRTVMLRPRGCGLMANTLHFEYEVQPAAKAFEKVPAVKIQREMLTLQDTSSRQRREALIRRHSTIGTMLPWRNSSRRKQRDARSASRSRRAKAR